jgi:protein-tyrosine phosphatase
MHDRVLQLDGALNFRDMGGYETGDGRSVRWRQLFRSDALCNLTEKDQEALRRLGLRAIYDLRDNGERATQPVCSALEGSLTYWTRSYDQSLGNLHGLMARDTATVSEASAVMMEIYARLPFEQLPSYRALLNFAATGPFPMVLNCSAGKDRTGLGAALILHALGVGRDRIVQDYLLSNDTYGAWAVAQAVARGLSISSEAARALGGVEDRYLQAAFLSIEAHSGSLDVYIKHELRLSDAAREAMRSRLLEAAA